MLDGTMRISYFLIFTELSINLTDLEIIIRKREVIYGSFYYSYWPRLNSTYTKTLDLYPSRVSTEIISHIKRGIQGNALDDGEKSEEKGTSSSRRSSTFTEQTREIICNLYEDYEILKIERGSLI